jgi:uncharacterized protein (DUF433 family)
VGLSGAAIQNHYFGKAKAAFWYTADMDALLSRITIEPAVCHGKPCVRGLRYPVEALLELLSSGMTIDEILADYEDLERDDPLAALTFAAWLARSRRLQPATP